MIYNLVKAVCCIFLFFLSLSLHSQKIWKEVPINGLEIKNVCKLNVDEEGDKIYSIVIENDRNTGYRQFMLSTSIENNTTEIVPLAGRFYADAKPLDFDFIDVNNGLGTMNFAYANEKNIKTYTLFYDNDTYHVKKRVEPTEYEINLKDGVETFYINDFMTSDNASMVFKAKSSYSNSTHLLVKNMRRNEIINEINLRPYGNNVELSKIIGFKTARQTSTVVLRHQDEITFFIYHHRDKKVIKGPQIRYNGREKYPEVGENQKNIIPIEGGIIKYYKSYSTDDNSDDITKIEIYNLLTEDSKRVLTIKGFKKINTIKLLNNNKIIVGGYTKEKGYKGFSNAKLGIFDYDSNLLYDKLWTIKNSTIEKIELRSSYNLNSKRTLVAIINESKANNHRVLLTALDKYGNLVTF